MLYLRKTRPETDSTVLNENSLIILSRKNDKIYFGIFNVLWYPEEKAYKIWFPRTTQNRASKPIKYKPKSRLKILKAKNFEKENVKSQ